MFPGRYFPPRYFAPRYFPKHGAAPPPAFLGQVKLVINGVERTDFLSYNDSISWNTTRGSRGTCNIPLVLAPEDTLAPQVGEMLLIYDPRDTRVWAGTIEKVQIRWKGDDGWRIITLTGVTLEQLFDTVELDKIKYAVGADPVTPTLAGDIFSDLLTRAGVSGVTAGTIDNGVTIQSLEVTNVAQAFATLALNSNYIWYVDPADLKIYFHAPTARAAPWTLAAEDIVYESMEWEQDRSSFRDTQIIQLPAVALTPITATFAGGVTVFTLPKVPEFLISVTISPTGASGRTVSWSPGSTKVTVSPAPPAASSVIIRFMDGGERTVTSGVGPGLGIGSQTRRYTLTRSFTEAGGLQEAEAMLARYSMLPATLKLDVDRPGVSIGRVLTIAVDAPIGADAVVNGSWLVMEVSGTILPGVDQRAEPFGHFRYTLRLINAAASAIFPGDGVTDTFVLPEVPSAVSSITMTNAFGPVPALSWEVGTAFIHSSPAIPVGSSIVVLYTGANTPTVPTFLNLWEDMTRVGETTPTPLALNPKPGEGDGSGGNSLGPYTFERTLTLRKTAVRDDCAPHTTVYHDGTAFRILGVLRKTILSDLTVRFNKTNIGSMSPLVPVELLTVTIPAGTVVNDTLEFSLATGSPAVLGQFIDKEVLTADILESDGSSDLDGVAQFTVQWTLP